VLTINFQSIKNKKPEVELIIESCKPSIIFGTETWLSNDISPYEYIPSSKYNIYTKNRKDGYGGVLLAISNQLTSTQITKAGTDLDLETNCENVWAKISYHMKESKVCYKCKYTYNNLTTIIQYTSIRRIIAIALSHTNKYW
jgi:exonuclease III